MRKKMFHDNDCAAAREEKKSGMPDGVLDAAREPDGLSLMKEKARAFIDKHLPYPLNAPDEAWEDAEFCLNAIGMKKNALRLVPRRFWEDAEFCLRAVKANPSALEWVHEKTVSLAICLTAVEQDGGTLDSVPQRFLTAEVILSAVKQNRNALQYIPDERRNEAEETLAERG